MAIWKQTPTLEHLHTIHLNTAPAALGLEFLEVGATTTSKAACRSTVSAQQTHLDRAPASVLASQADEAGACQRCGNNSPIMLFRCVGSRVSTSLR